MYRKSLKKSAPLFIVFIAVIFIVSGFIRIFLGFTGEEDTAVITYIRRQGGERKEATPNRYTYSISYTFTLPDGQKIDGFTYKIGYAVYVKVCNTNMSTVPVRYLKAFPSINTLEREAGLKAGNLILVCAGIILLKFVSMGYKA